MLYDLYIYIYINLLSVAELMKGSGIGSCARLALHRDAVTEAPPQIRIQAKRGDTNIRIIS